MRHKNGSVQKNVVHLRLAGLAVDILAWGGGAFFGGIRVYVYNKGKNGYFLLYLVKNEYSILYLVKHWQNM